jgi:NitT/TauT family transport system permease protein
VRDRVRKILLAGAALTILWQIAAFALDDYLVAYPLETFRALRVAVAGDDPLLAYLRDTAILALEGIAGGAAIATLLAFALRALPFGDVLLGGIAALLDPFPAVVLYPLFGLWLDDSPNAVLAVTAAGTGLPLLAAIDRGLGNVPRTYLDVARNIGWRGPTVFFRVQLPAAAPVLARGLRESAKSGFRALIAAELLLGALSKAGGLGGYLMSQNREEARANVLAAVLVVLALALVVDFLFRVLEESVAGSAKLPE